MLKYHLDENIDVSSRRTSFIESSVAWIKKRFCIGPQSRIADYGCGPGLYALRLARHGAQVTGIDFSKRSIEYAGYAAKNESLSIRNINENYLDFETNGQFDLIIMIMCDFCALSPAQRTVMLNKFSRQLTSGCLLLLDVYSLSAFEKINPTSTCLGMNLYIFQHVT
jgi:SAM-dependent methyltransferase